MSLPNDKECVSGNENHVESTDTNPSDSGAIENNVEEESDRSMDQPHTNDNNDNSSSNSNSNSTANEVGDCDAIRDAPYDVSLK